MDPTEITVVLSVSAAAATMLVLRTLDPDRYRSYPENASSVG